MVNVVESALVFENCPSLAIYVTNIKSFYLIFLKIMYIARIMAVIKARKILYCQNYCSTKLGIEYDYQSNFVTKCLQAINVIAETCIQHSKSVGIN